MRKRNSFGRQLRLTVRGASHAKAISFELENFPAGVVIDTAELRRFMERRAPGRDEYSTARHEADEVELVAGLREGMTDGSTIRGRIANTNVRPGDYGTERTVPRPGHADFGQWVEMGVIPTGGGSNSGRMTAALCAAGGLCKQLLAQRGIEVNAVMNSVGTARRPEAMLAAIAKAKRDGDSVGGTVTATIAGMPPGIGGALFDGIESRLSEAIFAIPGVKGVEFGLGFECTQMRGSEYDDPFVVKSGEVLAPANRQGGILGGRTSGMPIIFRVALRPTPTVFKELPSVDLATMQPATLAMKGRHDPCIVRRAVPVVEAVAALVATDCLLTNEAEHPRICLTLTGKTLDEDFKQFAAERYFTDIVELRADLLTPSERAHASEFPSRLPKHVATILTYRRQCDGGTFVGSEASRIAFFKKHLAAFDYVDFEDDFRDESLAALARKSGTRIVRSLHSFDGPIRNVATRARQMVKDTDEIAKIAMMPRRLADVACCFRETAGFVDTPHVICAMGPMGLATRVLAGRTHSLWTYASTSGLSKLGHTTPSELVRTYRFRTASRDAKLFGVTGFPLKVTRSPEINNAAWVREDEDAVMVSFPSATADEAIAFMKSMGMRGLAVTIPHKQKIMARLDRVVPMARAVGAVNTVSFERDRYVGYNTDVTGFAEAIEQFVTREGRKLSDLQVAVLGDGGAAQAVKTALKRNKVKFKVFHRQTPDAGFDLLVNATPVDPIPDYSFTGCELVYDLGYVPSVTPFMARAQAAGCKTENGFSMLQAQAREQRRIWLV